MRPDALLGKTGKKPGDEGPAEKLGPGKTIGPDCFSTIGK